MILRFVILLLFFLIFYEKYAGAVNLNLIPRQLIDEVNPKNQFSSPIREADEFRLVDIDSDSIVIGARNHVYQLSKSSLAPHNTIEWSAPAQVAEECSMKGRPTSDCHNFIRVVARRRNGHLLVCGTHAFSPQCREYEFLRSENRFKSQRDFNGRAITPYDPRANFTYVYSPETNEIFVATVSDFNGNDPLIYKKKIPTGDGIRTQKDDLRVLDHPDFVGSFAYKDFYYVWFRERASESSEEQIFSRVGRVCRNDNGGPSTTQDRWSSFLKARLNCSVAADIPFYFNELQSISEPVPQNDGDAIVYAVFSTSRSAVLMNAVCAFKMSSIDRVFNHGNFKTQRSVNSYSTQKAQNLRGSERPGKCPKDSRSAGDISFILKNPLMSDLVNAIDQPLLVEGPSKPDLTKVVAIGGVKAVERNQSYDVIYVGRHDGKVIKLIKTPHDSVMIESIAVFDNPPTGIQALRPLLESNELVVVGSDRVAKIPLYHCDKQTSCSRCVALRDPHCAWDTENLVCVHSNDWNFGSFVQNIVKGSSTQCPESAGDLEGYAINASPVMDSTKEFRQLLDEAEDDGFSATTIAMIIICAVLMATGLGFLIGYRISKWRFLSEIQTAHSSGSSSNGSDYDSFGRARLTRHDSLTTTSKLGGGDLYTMGPMGPKMSDAVSLVLGHHQHIPVLTSISNAGSGYTTPHHRLEHSAMLITNGSTGGGSAGSAASHAPSCTLPRDYKVKKVYL